MLASLHVGLALEGCFTGIIINEEGKLWPL